MFSRKTTALAATAAAGALAFLTAGPSDGASKLPISSCGQTATTDAVLVQDLVCAGSGIVVGASGISIDLHGHVLEGSGTNEGVDDLGGHDGVRIENGVVRSFNVGVYAVNGADNMTLSNVAVAGNSYRGAEIDGDSASVESSTVAGNGGDGMLVDGASASIKSSTAAGNGGDGIRVVGATPLVKSSTSVGNTG